MNRARQMVYKSRWQGLERIGLSILACFLFLLVFQTRTALAAPQVALTAPSDTQNGVGINTLISVTFDSDINPASLTNANFYVKASGGAAVTPAPGNGIVYKAASRTAVFTPAAALNPNTTYVVTLTTSVLNTAGTGLASNFTATFITGAAAYTSPHGSYMTSSACDNCHQTHTASGKSLLNKENQTAVCFTCHDGTGSSYNEKGYFNPAGSLTRTSFHKVNNTGPYGQGALECTDCHNPHGDTNGSGQYARLLKSSDGTNNYYQGNAFCLACHGTVNRSFPADTAYYASTAGDHTNGNAAHYNISKASLAPLSGTQITCVQCHDKHSGAYGQLLNTPEEKVCLNCHNSPANSMSGRNIEAEFSPATVTPYTVSAHDILGASGSKIECSSCHGPHSVGAAKVSAKGSFSDISTPANTKNTYTDAEGNITNFCLACHNGSPPGAAVTQTSVIPYTVAFAPALGPASNPRYTANDGNNGNGWDKSNFTTSAHYTNTTQKAYCDSCHQPHGSSYPRLRTSAEDSATVNGECLTCHGGTTGIKNVKPDLTAAYAHPTLATAGKHSDTEQYNTLTNSSNNRHAECEDCHDPHAAQSNTGAPVAPALPNPLQNVSGVSVNWGSTAWTPGSFTFENKANYEYQVCLKCHSSYSWGTDPPVQPSNNTAAETDIAMEINPNNASVHGVTEAGGKAPANYGAYINGWTYNAKMYCTDCHSSGWSPSVRGPHGASNKWILAAPWTTNTGTGSGDAGDLCFQCHDYNYYVFGTGSYAPVKSAFSNSGSNNLHGLTEHSQAGCMSCHTAIPHGYNNVGLLVQNDEAAPYNNGSRLHFDSSPGVPGNWNKDASPGCSHSLQGSGCH